MRSMNDDLKTSHAGLEFTSGWEGCILKPYLDIARKRTIGIGHLIRPGENFPDGVFITKDRALEILGSDLAKCEAAIKKFITVPLNQNQWDALIDFAFNCGTGVYTSSGACKALNAGQYDQVPTRLLDWDKAVVNGVKTANKGLYNRRKSEGELFMKSVDPSSEVDHAELTLEDKARVESWINASIQTFTDDDFSHLLYDNPEETA